MYRLYVYVCMYVVFGKIDHCIHIHRCIPMGLGHNDPWEESYIDVFPWDLDTMILGKSHTCDLNRHGVKGHLGVNDLCFKFFNKESLYPYWDLDTMIIGWSHTCDLNRLGFKGHLGVSDLWFKFLKKGSLYPPYFDVFSNLIFQ